MTAKTKIYIFFLLFFLCCAFILAGSPLALGKLHPSFTDGGHQEEGEKNKGSALTTMLEAELLPASTGITKYNPVKPAEKPADPDTAVPPEEEDKPAPFSLPSRNRPAGLDKLPAWDEALIARLSFLQSPIPGAGISSRDTQLPGAPRPYRYGTHEGLDYYSGYCGVPVNFGDPVYAAGPGIIYRIDHDYVEPEFVQRQEWLQESAAAGDTPEEILDKLRGRQVWIVHTAGVLTRYCHLHTVAAALQVGDMVEGGDFIGTVGNSGTSNGARGTRDDAHLHFEIWVDNYYLGEGLSPPEVRLLWEKVLLDSSQGLEQ